MWFLRRRVQVDRLPSERVTVQFEFRGADKRHFWPVLHRPEVDLCLADPGFDTDLCVTTDVGALTQVYLGQLSIAHALGDGSVTLAGRSQLRRAFGGWIGLSPFAAPGRRALAQGESLEVHFLVFPGEPGILSFSPERSSPAPSAP
jgi:hypothetical protein